MKKHLIAAAVAGALAVPAMAQVTVSGYLEVAYENLDNQTAADTSTIKGGSFGSSRIVFSGSEDLGGGLKAGFRLESAIDISNGRMGASTLGGQATSQQVFDRGAEINLSGAFGTVALGKLDHGGIEGNDLNVFGNWALGEGNVVEVGGAASDQNGTIRYTTPTMGGVSLNVAHTPEDNGASAVAASAHGGITSYQLTGSLGGVSFRLGGGTVDSTAGAETKVMGVAASYDFGPAAVSVFFQEQDNPNTTVDGKNTIVAVKVPVGNGLDVRALVENIDTGTAATEQDVYMIAVVKAMSKRTNVYGYYRDVDIKGGTADSSITGVAVSHSF